MRRVEMIVWLACLGGGLLGYLAVAIASIAAEIEGVSEVGAGILAAVIGLVTMRIMVLAGTPGAFAEIVPTVGPDREGSLPARAARLADSILHPDHHTAR